MKMQKSAGFTMLLGAVLVIVAVFTPAIQKYWFLPLPRVPENYQAGWLFGYRLFVSGGVIAAVGFTFLGRHTRRLSDDILVKLSSYVGDAFVIIGAVCWFMSNDKNIFPLLRAIIPANIILPWFTIFLNLSLFSFLIYGFGMIRVGYANWLGWGTLGFNALILIGYFIMGDIPPAVLYVWPLILGIGLIVRRGPSPKADS